MTGASRFDQHTDAGFVQRSRSPFLRERVRPVTHPCEDGHFSAQIADQLPLSWRSLPCAYAIA